MRRGRREAGFKCLSLGLLGVTSSLSLHRMSAEDRCALRDDV
jgi:hypothetical protein